VLGLNLLMAPDLTLGTLMAGPLAPLVVIRFNLRVHKLTHQLPI